MKKGIVVIDMQNDFVDGVLGTKEAQAIVPNVVKFLDNAVFNDIMVTMDTHYENYMETLEGKKLPVEHCINRTLCNINAGLNSIYETEETQSSSVIFTGIIKI